MIERYPNLYQIDENNNIRIWYMEQDEDKYRTVSGIENGNLVISSWKLANPKNIGKSNETTGIEQARLEILSVYKNKKSLNYHENKNDILNGSHIFEPMLAQKFKKWDDNWKKVYSNFKYDGIRCIATKDNLSSREGKQFISIPHISQNLKPFFNQYPDIIFDGELYNHELKEDFNKIISLVRKSKPTIEDILESEKLVQYHIYDCFDKNNPDLVYSERLELLKSFKHHLNSDIIQFAPVFISNNSKDLDEVYSLCLKEGYEGQIVRLDTPYENKRTKNLLKRKEFIDEEFKIISIEEGEGNWQGYAKICKCVTNQGKLFGAGIKGNQDFCRELLHRKIKPVEATIRYQSLTPDEIPRFPIAVAFWDEERDL